MREPRPASLPARLDDLWVSGADVGVEQHARAQPQSVQGLDHPPDADTGPDVAPAVVQRAGGEPGGAAENARRRTVDLVVLDVEADVEGHARAVRPGQGGTFRNWAVFEQLVVHWTLSSASSKRRLDAQTAMSAFCEAEAVSVIAVTVARRQEPSFRRHRPRGHHLPPTGNFAILPKPEHRSA